jgi:hypothetical protein
MSEPYISLLVKPSRLIELVRLIEEEPYWNKHMALLENDKRWKELKVILSVE